LEWLEKHRSTLATALVVLVAVAGFAVLQIPRRPALQVTAPTAPIAPPSIKVHVVGEALSPGVYQLMADARVEDALKAAGGPSVSADVSSLNLALPLKDGQQVMIPQLGSPPQAGSAPPAGPPQAAPGSGEPAAKIDLNRATMAQLDTLPGIGLVTGQKILDYRAKQGRFTSIEELKDAKLVNAPTYDKIKDLVEVR
jgi:competence protein ComEA